VDRGQAPRRRARDHEPGEERLSLAGSPALPETGERHGPVRSQARQVRLPPAPLAAPLVESVGNHQTAPAPEGVAERRWHGDRLGASVDGAWGVVEGRGEARNEAPADGAETALLALLHDDDEVLARAEVVARAQIDARGRLGSEFR